LGGFTLSEVVKIALDAMGGDSAPASVVDGADIAKAKSPHIEICLLVMKIYPTAPWKIQVF